MTNNHKKALLSNPANFELTSETLAYDLSMDFSNQIVMECEKKGLSLSDYANKLGVGLSTLSEKLNGQNLTLKSIAAMALALGFDVEAPRLIEMDSTINASSKCLSEIPGDFLNISFNQPLEAKLEANYDVEGSNQTTLSSKNNEADFSGVLFGVAA